MRPTKKPPDKPQTPPDVKINSVAIHKTGFQRPVHASNESAGPMVRSDRRTEAETSTNKGLGMRLSSFLIATTVMFGLVRAAQAGLYDGQPIAAPTPGAASPADPIASPSDGSLVSQATLSLPSVSGNSCGCAGCSSGCNGCGGDGCQSFQSGPCDCKRPPRLQLLTLAGGLLRQVDQFDEPRRWLLGFIAPSDRLFS